MLEAQQWVGNGRYQLVRFLRAGGAGVVWEARDRRPRPGESAAVAIKVLDAAAGGAAAAEREAEGAARVQHPNVVRVRDTFTEDGLAFMVMELAVGSLADLVAREGPFPPPIALGCALQACEALAAAHRAGVVHRDVKPHNLLVFADGSVRLADFGAARALMDGHTRTRTGALLGSIPFMAPEQRRDARAVQPATDVYALAVTLGWLLLGEAPEEPWTEEAAAQLRSVRAPEGLVHAFAAAGARRPEDRPANGAALLEVLRGCGVVPAPVPMPEGWEGVREDAPGGARLRTSKQRNWGSAAVRTALVACLVTGLLTGGLWGAKWAPSNGSDRAEFDANANPAPSAPEAASEGLPWCDVSARGFAMLNENGPRETEAVGAGDLDGDGVMDALYTNQLDENVTVWWGRMDRTPGDRQDISTGRSGFAPEVGDFDADGRPDILISLSDDSAFALLRGLGERRFAPPQRIMQGPSPHGARLIKLLSGPAVLFPAGENLMLRAVTSALPWPAQQRVGHLDATAGTTVGIVRRSDAIYVAVNNEKGQVLELDGDGRVRTDIVHTEWPVTKRIFVADLTPSTGEELYGVLGDDTAVRLPLGQGEEPCRASAPMLGLGILTQLNGDGIPDEISAQTCTGCTSQHNIRLGQSG